MNASHRYWLPNPSLVRSTHHRFAHRTIAMHHYSSGSGVTGSYAHIGRHNTLLNWGGQRSAAYNSHQQTLRRQSRQTRRRR